MWRTAWLEERAAAKRSDAESSEAHAESDQRCTRSARLAPFSALATSVLACRLDLREGRGQAGLTLSRR